MWSSRLLPANGGRDSIEEEEEEEPESGQFC